MLSMTSVAQRILPTGAGIVGVGVNAMLAMDGMVVIGGQYASFNGHARRNLQGWDGAQHFDLTGAFEGTSNRVNALIEFGGDLVAAGTDGAGNIQRWNGTSWNTMGSGVSGQARALAVHAGILYCTHGTSVSAWDGTQWTSAGSDLGGTTTCLEVHEGSLYVGGGFDQALARWNGTSWDPLANGLNNTVLTLHSTPEGLVVGGNFTGDASETQQLPHWTVYDGSFFSTPLEDPGTVFGLTTLSDGRLLVGGGSRSLLVGPGHTKVITFSQITSTAEISGRVLVAGNGTTNSYTLVQRIGELREGTDEVFLDIGGLSARISPSPKLFHRSNPSSAAFEAPKGSGLHSLFMVAPWLMGQSNGELQGFIPTDLEDSVITCGPGVPDPDTQHLNKYYQVWKLDLADVLEHVAHWADVGYEVPASIAHWPGNGDIASGEPARLAPYFDTNENGRYEPEQGEYPIIRGDQAVYQILHTRFPRDLDIHLLHYAYADAANEDVHNTIFSNLRIINRGEHSLEQARFGLFTDFEIGCATDDFGGCDSLRNLYYGYNGTDTDCGTGNSYGARPGAQGVVYLDHWLTAHRTWANGSSSPWTWHALTGTYLGDPFTQTGYPSHFEFPGGAFTESTAGNEPGDRHSVGSIGPFTLAPGDTLCVDVAFPFARSATEGVQPSLDLLFARSDGIQAWYNARSLSCNSYPDMGVGITEIHTSPRLELMPNPAVDRVGMKLPRSSGERTVEIMNATGQVVLAARMPNAVEFHQMDITILEPGLHLIRVVTREQVLSGKFIKQP